MYPCEPARQAVSAAMLGGQLSHERPCWKESDRSLLRHRPNFLLVMIARKPWFL